MDSASKDVGSTLGNNMAMAESCEASSLVAQYPEEVYEMIFSHLEDFKDLMTVSNSTPKFQRILDSGKTAWLFEGVFPHIFPKLKTKDILNCRLVCKQWNRSVDNFLHVIPTTRDEFFPYQNVGLVNRNLPPEQVKAITQNHPPHSIEYQPTLESKELFYLNSYPTEDKLPDFLASINNYNNPWNPFVLRSVGFESSSDERPTVVRDYWNLIVHSLLPKFGHHIWRASIYPVLQDDLIFCYEQLCEALRRMPNLRTLFVLGDHDHYGVVQIRQLKEYIRRNPLPELPHLHILKEVMDVMTQAPVMNELMRRYSSQLEMIMFSLSIWNRRAHFFRNLPQVTNLDLIVNVSRQKWQKFCRLVNAPKLGKLSLNVQQTMKTTHVLKHIQPSNFPSLVYLKLRFHFKPNDYGSSLSPQFQLLNVKTLEICESSNVPYDQILKHIPQLEYMLVCHDHIRGISLDDGQFKIRQYMSSGNMYESNIWAKIPSLKKFTVARLGDTGDTENEIFSRKEYIRDMYEYLRSKNIVQAENGNLREYTT